MTFSFPHSIGRRVKAAIESRVQARTIKGSDERRTHVAKLHRLWHRQDYARRQDLAKSFVGTPALHLPSARGFLVVPKPTFAEIPEMVQHARERVAALGAATPRADRLRVTWGLLDVDGLQPTSPFVRFATHPDVLAVIIEYLGAVPILWTADVWCSVAHTNPSAPSESELFHCDWDAISQVKIFVHCSDVALENGPLTVIDATTSQHVRTSVGYKYGERVSDATMTSLTSPSDTLPLVGPAGSMSFVDTSRCFHFGSRVVPGAGPRIVAMFQYVIPSAFVLPRDYRRKAPLREKAAPGMTRVQELVLGAD